MKQKNKKSGFLGMLSVTLCPSLLGTLLKSKDAIRAAVCNNIIGERKIRAGKNF